MLKYSSVEVFKCSSKECQESGIRNQRNSVSPSLRFSHSPRHHFIRHRVSGIRLHFLLIIVCLFSLAYGQQYNESNDFSYAIKLFNEGFYDIAAQQFSAFVNHYPSSDRLADAKYYLAESLYRIKDYQNARIEFQSLAVTFPDHERAPQAWKMVGELYEVLGNYKEAAKAYETVKVLYPSNSLAPQSMLKAAEAYSRLDLFTQADRIIKEFLDRYVEAPEYPEGHLVYGNLLTQKGDFDRAKSEFERAASLTKDKNISAKANLGIASVYQKLGLLSQAESYYQSAMNLNPNSATARSAVFSLARIHQDMREWDKAITLLEKRKGDFAAADDQLKVNMMLAQSYFLKQDYYSARKTLDKISASSAPESIKQMIHFYSAACYQEEGKIAQAITEYESIILPASQTGADTGFVECLPASYINLSKLYLQTQNLQKARQTISDFHKRYPAKREGEELYFLLIQKAFDLGDISVAADEMQKFTAEFPGSGFQDNLMYAAGNAFFKKGDYAESRRYYQKISESYYCNEDFDSARLKLGFINSYLYRAEGRGVSELARLFGRTVTDVRVQLELGIFYLRDLKDFQAAAEIFEKCKSQSNDSSIVGKALYYLSETYMAQAQIEAFPDSPRSEQSEKAVQNLKQAMVYIKYVPNPDSLMFRFLAWTIPPDNSQSSKALEFWKHFENAYPSSPLIPEAQLRLAEISIALGDTENAYRYLNKIISGKGDSYFQGKAYWEKAMLQEKNQKRQEAIQTLKDFLLNIAQHPYRAKAYWQLANYHAVLGDYASAAKFLEELLRLYAYTDYAHEASVKIVDYYISNGDYVTAFNFIQAQVKNITLNNDPVVKYYMPAPDADFYFYAGKARYQLKEYPEARSNIMNYLSLSSSQIYRGEAFYILGKISYDEGNNEAALTYFSLISAADSPVFFNKANEIAADIHFTKRAFGEARAKYEALIAASDDVNKKIYYAAQRLRCLVNEENAKLLGSELASFQRQYKNHPEFDSYLASVEFEEGKRDYLNKNFDSALRHFSTILKKYKRSGYADDALYYEGLCYTTLNKSDDALDRLTKFLKEYPNSSIIGDVYITIANLYMRGEKTELAVSALQKAVETAVTPESKMNAISNSMKLYKNLGMWDSALRLARQYVEQFPNAEDIVDAKILIGICLTSLNRYSEAIDYLKKVKFEATAEQEPEIQFYVGEAYFNAGRYEEAIGEFVKIPLLSKKTKLQWEASALYYSGQAYEKLARVDDAVRMYKEIVERPGILLELKREAQHRIEFLTN